MLIYYHIYYNSNHC